LRASKDELCIPYHASTLRGSPKSARTSERENLSLSNFTVSGLEGTPRGVSAESVTDDDDEDQFRNLRGYADALASALGGAAPVGAVNVGSVLCGYQCLGAQREEAHHVTSDRKPQQMDAGFDLAAQR
jgi:hypothetical protein